MNHAPALPVIHRLLAFVLLPMVGFTGQLSAQSDGDAFAETLRELRVTQQRMERKIDRLQSTVDQLATTASDLSKVTIRIQSPQGKPVAGYSVEVELDVSDGRVAKASGTSDDFGLAIERHLPYGQYDVNLKAGGWAAYVSDVVVEVGRPLTLTLIAPDLEATGKLIVQSDLQAKHLKELPFGELRDYRGARAYSPRPTPEPDETNGSHYPKLGKGIERVAIPIDVEMDVTLEQPDLDEPIEWHWKDDRVHNDGQLVLTVDGTARIHIVNSPRMPLRAGRKFYTEASDDLSLGYLTIDRFDALNGEAELDVPTGAVRLTIRNPYGELTKTAMQALSIEPKEDASVWLNTELRDDSKWIDEIFDADSWTKSDRMFELLEQTLPITANETATVTFKTH